MYFNNKGVTRPNNLPDVYWRDYQDYYNIERYKDCNDLLNSSDHNVCGVELGYTIKDKNTYSWDSFVGNHWWAKSKYIKTLQRPIKTSDRALYETWLFHENIDWRKERANGSLKDNLHINPYCFNKAIISLTEVCMLPESYKDTSLYSKDYETQNSIIASKLYIESQNYLRLNTLMRIRRERGDSVNFGEFIKNEISKHYMNKYPVFLYEKYNWKDVDYFKFL
jgi:hypothetical protein